jgi:hypothetical protein
VYSDRTRGEMQVAKNIFFFVVRGDKRLAGRSPATTAGDSWWWRLIARPTWTKHQKSRQRKNRKMGWLPVKNWKGVENVPKIEKGRKQAKSQQWAKKLKTKWAPTWAVVKLVQPWLAHVVFFFFFFLFIYFLWRARIWCMQEHSNLVSLADLGRIRSRVHWKACES